MDEGFVGGRRRIFYGVYGWSIWRPSARDLFGMTTDSEAVEGRIRVNGLWRVGNIVLRA